MYISHCVQPLLLRVIAVKTGNRRDRVPLALALSNPREKSGCRLRDWQSIGRQSCDRYWNTAGCRRWACRLKLPRRFYRLFASARERNRDFAVNRHSAHISLAKPRRLRHSYNNLQRISTVLAIFTKIHCNHIDYFFTILQISAFTNNKLFNWAFPNPFNQSLRFILINL